MLETPADGVADTGCLEPGRLSTLGSQDFIEDRRDGRVRGVRGTCDDGPGSVIKSDEAFVPE